MGRYWAYFDADGNRITDREEIDRLNAIGLPPAYSDAWFCADPNGHLQATGIDARGRKQYRYHAEFREKRESAKYEGLLEFGKALPRAAPARRAGPQAPQARRARRCSPPSSACSTPSTSASATRNMRGTTRASARPRCSTRHLRRRAKADDAIRRQARDRPRGEDHRLQPEAHLQALPGAAGPDAVPICERRR